MITPLPRGLFGVVLVVLGGLRSAAIGQANFVENFDDLTWNNPGEFGPAVLIARGWTFRMQSDPAGGSFSEGAPAAMPPQSGDKFMGASFSHTFHIGEPPVTLRLWAILPEIPRQRSGDPISIWLRAAGTAASHDAQIQVRYSPSGGIGTGSGPSGVGDFTQVLIDADPVPHDVWTEFTATAPGPGRLAITYSSIAARFAPADYVGIDTLAVGMPDPPCTLPPLPQPGQQVNWTLPGSPYVLCRDATIPAGGALVIEPGVHVLLDPGVVLTVAGAMTVGGVPGDPVVIRASDPFSINPPRIEVNAGALLEMEHSTGAVLIVPKRLSSVICRDCLFTGSIEQTEFLQDVFYLELERCRFSGGTLALADGTVVLRDVTFNNPLFGVVVAGCYPFFENVTVNGSTAAGAYLLARPQQQPVYMGNVSVTNSNGPGLKLWGGNFHVGPTNTLQGNSYAVSGDPGFGLLPGSVIPTTGNTNNHVQAGEAPGFADLRVQNPIWAPVGVPYVLDGDVFLSSSRWTILPGVHVQMKPGSGILPDAGRLIARGLPGAPITFERFDPAQPWDGLHYTRTQRIEYCVIDGSLFGAFAGLGAGHLDIDNCVFRNNERATAFSSTVQGTRYLNNLLGAHSGDLNGRTNPNSFVGNTLAVNAAADASHNWWGDASGPTSPENPGGTGDPINQGVPFRPFLTSAPDFGDHPPVVNLNQPSFLFEPGAKVLLTWDASDDQAIVSQRIEFSNPNTGTSTIVAGLGPEQRAYEWTVPDIGSTVSGGSPSVRVVSIDSTGQEGWDRAEILIPAVPPSGNLVVTSNVGGQTFTCGDVIALTSTGGATDGWLVLDGEGRMISLGAVTDVVMPFISTDSARLAVRRLGATNSQEWAFSQPFAIRPDSRLGDQPPAVTLLTPAAGQSLPGGTVVPITWLAQDDEAVRSIDIHASYDGGRTWHAVVRHLPGSSTGYDWRLPPSEGITDVRVRVVVSDLRFQNSSDGADRPIQILPGRGCYPDCDQSGVLDLFDFLCFQTSFVNSDPYACDCDPDPACDLFDFLCFQTAFVAGCP